MFTSEQDSVLKLQRVLYMEDREVPICVDSESKQDWEHRCCLRLVHSLAAAVCTVSDHRWGTEGFITPLFLLLIVCCRLECWDGLLITRSGDAVME